MRALKSLLAVVVLLALGGAAVVYSGWYDVAGDGSPSAFEERLLNTVKDRSIARRAKGIVVPDLSGLPRLARGHELYRVHCVSCHGGPGVSPDGLSMGLTPVPPPLDAERVQAKGDAELFWVLKHGIRFTGMPGFALAVDNEDDLWALVAYVRQLPKTDPNAFQAGPGADETVP